MKKVYDLPILKRLTQFWNVKLHGQSQQKDSSGLWVPTFGSGHLTLESTLISTIVQISYAYRHCTTGNRWQDDFGYTSDQKMMHQAYLVDGLQLGKDFDYKYCRTYLQSGCEDQVPI